MSAAHATSAPAPRYVLTRLVPPRPDFAMTMSPAERATMGEHVAYCKSLFEKGKALSFGPIVDREAVWLRRVEVADDVEARAIVRRSPAESARATSSCRF